MHSGDCFHGFGSYSEHSVLRILKPKENDSVASLLSLQEKKSELNIKLRLGEIFTIRCLTRRTSRSLKYSLKNACLWLNWLLRTNYSSLSSKLYFLAVH
jgi:hypothetical protein